MPLWLVIPAAYAALVAGLAVAGYRWQSVRPRATHTPDIPAAPEEGTHS